MQLTRAADYAVRVLVQLATLPPGSRMQLSDLATAADVPSSFVAKVLQRLARAGLVLSRRGMKGGFELTATGARATLLEVVESIEGPIRLNLCIGEGPGCARQGRCGAHPVWVEAQRALIAVLGSATLQSLARAQTEMARIENNPGHHQSIDPAQLLESRPSPLH
jgi:Rrf2 family iron-sulfur cluster assembly transcriptional regulator